MRRVGTGKPNGIRKGLLTAAAMVLLATAAQAGPIFFAGRLEDGKFTPDKNVKGPCYTVRYSTITATIDGDAARTKIEETIVRPTASGAAEPEAGLQTVCLIPLPEGADGDGATFAAGPAKAAPAAVTGAKYLRPDEAQKVYEAVARGSGFVEILCLTGRPAILVPAFELKGTMEIVVEFRQKVRDSEGVLALDCPMPATKWTRQPVSRLSLTATVRSAKPLRAVFSPTHNAAVERKGLNEAVARVKADNWSGGDDFRLCYVADADDLGLRVLAHRGEDDEDGYFMVVGNPTGDAGGKEGIEKDLVFVLDTSGSMRGEKIEQARSAIEYCLEHLSAGDRFNIITFGTEVVSFRDGPVGRSPETLAAARQFIDSAVAGGLTNIGGALAKGLSGTPQQGRPRIMIFMTDGTPTAGELVPEKIVEGVQSANASGTRIFVMGVGHDVNAHLLDRLAETTDGSSEYVATDEEIDVKVAALYDRLSHPVLTNVEVVFGELRTNSVYPAKLPALFKGTEIMIFGRYRDGGTHTVTVSGMLAGKKTSYTCKADFPGKPVAGKTAGQANEFVAPLWAARKIGYLLQEIRLHGENKELIEEVVRLSKKFGIVTEYTEFLAFARNDMDASSAVKEARDRMTAANTHKTGQWAVNQAYNDSRLQQRVVASAEGNTYVDRRGNVVANDNIQQVGRRVFYLRDGQWMDSEDAGKRKTRTVKLFSDEYMQLLRNNREFARAQSLGWAVSVNVGDERIVVEKDGKTKDEELQKRQSESNDSQNVNQQQIPRNQLNQNQAPIRNDAQQQVPAKAVPQTKAADVDAKNKEER